jgi:hypothetical protein
VSWLIVTSSQAQTNAASEALPPESTIPPQASTCKTSTDSTWRDRSRLRRSVKIEDDGILFGPGLIWQVHIAILPRAAVRLRAELIDGN